MKKRFAGKNQVFWGFCSVISLVSYYSEKILNTEISAWQVSFLFLSFFMFLVKSVDWEEVRYGSCCSSCRPNAEGECNDKSCYCHGRIEMR